MKREEITHLASLARIRITDKEAESYSAELSQIVEYVSTVASIAADDSDSVSHIGVRYNVLRDDVVTIEPDQYTADALREMPQTDGRHLLVKKIMKAK